jgi:hypothetical protein
MLARIKLPAIIIALALIVTATAAGTVFAQTSSATTGTQGAYSCGHDPEDCPMYGGSGFRGGMMGGGTMGAGMMGWGRQ